MDNNNKQGNISLERLEQKLTNLENRFIEQNRALESTRRNCAAQNVQLSENANRMHEMDVILASKETSVQLLISTSKQYMPIGDELCVDMGCGRAYNVVHDAESGQIVFETFHESMH